MRSIEIFWEFAREFAGQVLAVLAFAIINKLRKGRIMFWKKDKQAATPEPAKIEPVWEIKEVDRKAVLSKDAEFVQDYYIRGRSGELWHDWKHWVERFNNRYECPKNVVKAFIVETEAKEQPVYTLEMNDGPDDDGDYKIWLYEDGKYCNQNYVSSPLDDDDIEELRQWSDRYKCSDVVEAFIEKYSAKPASKNQQDEKKDKEPYEKKCERCGSDNVGILPCYSRTDGGATWLCMDCAAKEQYGHLFVTREEFERISNIQAEDNGELWVRIEKLEETLSKTETVELSGNSGQLQCEHEFYAFAYDNVENHFHYCKKCKVLEILVDDEWVGIGVLSELYNDPSRPDDDSEIVARADVKFADGADGEVTLKVGDKETAHYTPKVTSEKIGENERRIEHDGYWYEIRLCDKAWINIGTNFRSYMGEYREKVIKDVFIPEAERIYKQEQEKKELGNITCIKCGRQIKGGTLLSRDEAGYYICSDCIIAEQERETLVERIEKYRKVWDIAKHDNLSDLDICHDLKDLKNCLAADEDDMYDVLFAHLLELMDSVRNQEKVYYKYIKDKDAIADKLFQLVNIVYKPYKQSIKQDVAKLAEHLQVPELSVICDLILACQESGEA